MCAGTNSEEICGGRNKMTAYKFVQEEPPVEPEYIGCYGDARVRAMNAEGKYTNGAMTNEVSLTRREARGRLRRVLAMYIRIVSLVAVVCLFVFG